MTQPQSKGTHPSMSIPITLEDIELHPRVRSDIQITVSEKNDVNVLVKFLHSFKRRERSPSILDDLSRPVEGDTSPLNRSLKGRHLQFIAIGGSIGAGLFIGCGKALAIGGPAWLLIAFAIVGVMLLCVMHALGELAAVYPISGTSSKSWPDDRIIFNLFD